MTPAISVCVPTYNGTKYLRECLDSILAQSLENFEVVVVDDQSSDGSFELATEYAARDRRVRLYRNQQNLGLVANWNRCLDLANGEWMKFVFQDDRIGPQCLEHLLRASRSDVPLTACQRDCIFDGVSASTRKDFEAQLAKFHAANLFPGLTNIPAALFCAASIEHLAVNFLGEPTALMFHRDALRRFGNFNPDFIQLCDFEYWARIASHTGFTYVPETLATFRVHGQSTTATNERRRYFRCQVIDPLLLIYQFAYDPRFIPMREAARRLGVNLRRVVAERTHEAATLAARDAEDPLVADAGPQEEWNRVTLRYPALKRSVYGDLYKIRDGLKRHIAWRFRRENYQVFNKETGCKVPITIAVDIEPDAFFTDRDNPVPWTGYEVTYDYLSSVRSQLAAATGSPANFFWTLRMDPQVAETYGSPDWGARHYEKEIHDCQSQGDEFGVHTHAYRWDDSLGSWIVDHGNQPWVDHCVESSFDTFRAVFGKDCRSFRFGDGWMSNATMQLVEKLGAQFDLTLEPGQEPHSAVFPDKPFTGSLPDLRDIPVSPYRPDRRDFTKSDPLRNDGIWIIPLSAGPLSDDSGSPIIKPKYQTLNLGVEPEVFHGMLRYLFSVLKFPYLTFITRSDIGIYPKLLRNLKANLITVIRHPLAKQFVFCPPVEAMDRLGYSGGIHQSVSSDMVRPPS